MSRARPPAPRPGLSQRPADSSATGGRNNKGERRSGSQFAVLISLGSRYELRRGIIAPEPSATRDVANLTLFTRTK